MNEQRCCRCARSWNLCHQQKEILKARPAGLPSRCSHRDCRGCKCTMFRNVSAWTAGLPSARRSISASRCSHRDCRGCKCTMFRNVSVSRYSHRDSRGCKCTMLIHFWNMKPKYMLYYLLRELSLGLISRCHAPRMRMHAHVNIDSRL